MLIKDALVKDKNNFNLLRIVLASLVIIYHSFALFESHGHSDPVKYYFHIVSTGGLAVKAFFFLSGLLVTNSISKNRSAKNFIFSRTKRILPGYISLMFFSCFLIGPFLSTLSIIDYFSNAGLWGYFFNNISLNTSYFLPGVFSDSKYAFNGSIWTIPMEVKCYAALLFFSIFCRLTSNRLSLFICLIIIMLPATQFRDWIFSSNGDPAIYMLAPCFALGCLCAILKNHSIPNPFISIMAIFVSFFIDNELIKSYLVCFSFCLLGLYFFSTRLVLKVKIKNDPSYGMYLWAFPAQQFISHYITENIILGCITSIALSLCLGMISWKYIEKPFIQQKRAL